jgi:hypothetical protein
LDDGGVSQARLGGPARTKVRLPPCLLSTLCFAREPDLRWDDRQLILLVMTPVPYAVPSVAADRSVFNADWDP